MSFNISQFFGDIGKKLDGEERFKECIIASIAEVTGQTLEKTAVTYQSGVIRLSIDSYTRTEIQLRKDEILSRIRAEFPEKKIKDIF